MANLIRLRTNTVCTRLKPWVRPKNYFYLYSVHGFRISFWQCFERTRLLCLFQFRRLLRCCNGLALSPRRSCLDYVSLCYGMLVTHANCVFFPSRYFGQRYRTTFHARWYARKSTVLATTSIRQYFLTSFRSQISYSLGLSRQGSCEARRVDFSCLVIL